MRRCHSLDREKVDLQLVPHTKRRQTSPSLTTCPAWRRMKRSGCREMEGGLVESL